MFNILGVSDVQGPVSDLFAKLGGPGGKRWLKDFKRFLRKENPFADLDYSFALADWEEFYRKIHGLKTDFSGIHIPEADNNDFLWLVCRPENFFAERAYSGGKQLYPKWKWTDSSLDDELKMRFGRDGEKDPYIIRFRPNWEADEDLANLSANMIAKKGINTACLTERLILGDFLYWKFRRHLDVIDTTLSSGSRYDGGDVPRAYWGGRYSYMGVDGCYPDDCLDELCARRVVVS